MTGNRQPAAAPFSSWLGRTARQVAQTTATAAIPLALLAFSGTDIEGPASVALLADVSVSAAAYAVASRSPRQSATPPSPTQTPTLE